ncbi:MAG TPA: signal peptidase I [Blastocatellia bacterium]|nr:signal peptidase I [Blastocatellia bacterium]
MKKRSVVLLTLGVILFVALCYYFLFIRMVKVPTGSMKNTILPGDRLAINLLGGEIRRGDIVMFNYPKDPSTRFVSRVIGLPGETIEVRKQRVYINGTELGERRLLTKSQSPEDPAPLEAISSEGDGSYTVSYDAEEAADTFGYEAGDFAVRAPFQIPADNYFVMGDNRDNSLDSRFWGPLPRKLIVGKAFLIYWSEDRASGKTRWSRMPSRLK